MPVIIKLWQPSIMLQRLIKPFDRSERLRFNAAQVIWQVQQKTCVKLIRIHHSFAPMAVGVFTDQSFATEDTIAGNFMVNDRNCIIFLLLSSSAVH